MTCSLNSNHSENNIKAASRSSHSVSEGEVWRLNIYHWKASVFSFQLSIFKFELWVRHDCDTNDTSATQVTHERHKCATRMLHERHECIMSGTRENFDFDNNVSENIFSQPILATSQMKDCKKRNKKYLLRTTLKMPRSHTKIFLKSEPQKQNCNGNSYMK